MDISLYSGLIRLSDVCKLFYCRISDILGYSSEYQSYIIVGKDLGSLLGHHGSGQDPEI